MRLWAAGVGETDPLRRYARLYLVQQRPDGREDTLLEDGTFTTVEPGVFQERAGLALAYPALQAIFDGLTEWKGLQSHQATEARILREWLEVERARVDTLTARLGAR
jgi:hypothetical protein